MKFRCLAVAVTTCSLGLFSGCSRDTASDQAVGKPADAEAVKQKASETLQTAKEYAASKKDEYQKRIEAETVDLGARIDELKKKAESATADAKEKLDAQIGDLDARRTDIAKRLAELKDSTSLAWEDMKVGIDKAVDELKQSYEKAKSRF